MKMLLRCLARIGAISRSMAWIASLVCEPDEIEEHAADALQRPRRCVSSASIVLAKVGASASSAMAAISALLLGKRRVEGGPVMLRRDALEGRKAERRASTDARRGLPARAAI